MTGLFLGSVPTVQVKAARRDANIFANNGQQVALGRATAFSLIVSAHQLSKFSCGAIQDWKRDRPGNPSGKARFKP